MNEQKINMSAVQQDNDNDDDEDDDKAVSIQITEDQMLDIAEQVFQLMADEIKAKNSSIKQVFGKHFQLIDEFEGEKNVLVIAAADFLEDLKHILSDQQISEIEIACLMRVLSKPEINHCVVVSELQLVLENFGIPITQHQPDLDNSNTQDNNNNDVSADLSDLKEEAKQKKQK